MVVSFGSSSGWSDINSSVNTARCFSTFVLAVVISIPSSHGRTQAAASTRPPTSTTHMRQTPTGS